MKLTSTLVKQTVSQFEAQLVPEDHPLVPQLNKIYGDHTYFIDQDGLSIVERTEPIESGSARVIKLADWKDASRTRLQPHSPEPTDVVIALDPEPES